METKKISIEELGKCLNLDIKSEHICKESSNDFSIVNVSFSEVPQIDWILAHLLIAKEKDVYDGEAEYIGELLDSYYLMIQYCPFCGEKLNI